MAKPDPTDLPCGITALPGIADILVDLATDVDGASCSAGWARDVVKDHGWAAITYLRRVEAHITTAQTRLDQLRRAGVI